MDPERPSSSEKEVELEEEVGSSDEDHHQKQQNKPSEAALVEGGENDDDDDDDSEEDRVSGTQSDDHHQNQPSAAAAAAAVQKGDEKLDECPDEDDSKKKPKLNKPPEAAPVEGENNDDDSEDHQGDEYPNQKLDLKPNMPSTLATVAAPPQAAKEDEEEDGDDASGSEEEDDEVEKVTVTDEDDSSEEEDSNQKLKPKAKQNKPTPHFVNPKLATMEEKEGNDDSGHKEEKGEDVEEIDDDSGSFSSSSSDGSDGSHAHLGKTVPSCTPTSTASKTRHGEEEDDDSGSGEEEKEEEEVDEANEVQQIKNKKKPSLSSSAGGGDPLTSIASKEILKEKLFDVKESKLAHNNLHKPKVNKLWSSEDKVAILEGLIRFKENEGYYPSGKLMTNFYEFIRNSITPGLNQKQLSNKIKKLRDMYHSHAQKGKGVFSTNLDLKCFELSKTIWANKNIVFPKTGSHNGKRKSMGNIAGVKYSKDGYNNGIANEELVVRGNTLIDSESLDLKVFWDKFPCFQVAMDLELYGMLQVEKNVEMEAMMKIGIAKASEMEEKLKSIRAKKIQMSMQQQDVDRESQDVQREIKRMRLSFM